MKKKIISIGALTDMAFIDEYAKAYELEHINVRNYYAPEDIFNTVLSETYDYIYIHLKQIDAVADEIVFMFQRLAEAAKGRIIVGAPGYQPASELLMNIRNVGIKYFVLADIYFGQKDEFEKYMASSDNEDTSLVPHSSEMLTEQKPPKPIAPIMTHGEKGTTIAVVSKTPRIGTTTLALQITKYIKMMGYKACYIQMQDDGWVQLFDKWMDDTIHDSDIGYVIHKDVNMYYNLNKISSILNMGYDYYIYDYGNSSNSVSIMEKDIKICIAGTFPSEIDDTQSLISQYYNSDMMYCFNLVPESERDDILELMDTKAESTFFLDYCPDPFFLSSGNIETFDKVFRINKKAPEEENQHKKRRKLFGR